jgi:preprotein translocase subunit SecD
MYLRNRFIITTITIILALIYIWPNIAQRDLQIFYVPNFSAEQSKKTFEGLKKRINEKYPNEYHLLQAEINDEQIILLKGRFIQTALINEIGLFRGIDAERTSLKTLWMEESLKARPFKLGLDLQGGMNLVLQADFEALRQQLEKQFPPEKFAEIEKQLSEAKDEETKANLEGQLNQMKDALNFTEQRMRLDTEGALEIIRSRIDSTGVSEPLIRLQGYDRIEINLPGVSSPQQAKKVVSSTARVAYQLAEPSGPNGEAGEYSKLANQSFDQFVSLGSDLQKRAFIRNLEQELKLPSSFGIYTYYSKLRNEDNQLALLPSYFMVLKNEVSLSGESMSRSVYANFDSEAMQHTVEFELTSEGREKFAQITRENTGKQLAILIDGKIRSAPSINEPITGGRARISGSFSQQEAKDLALIIKEGALPVPINIVEERTIGPSLGKQSIELGVKAIVIGMVLVILFMLSYYLLAGVLANIALALNLFFLAGIFALMDFTITLPGLAGIVLTLGMAVDANVIIFERIKEELAAGKKIKVAVANGFERATYTILDANITTMIAAIVLSSKLGAGPIKGFGVTLFAGILTSLYSTLYVSKSLVYFLVFNLNLEKFPIQLFSSKSKRMEAA